MVSFHQPTIKLHSRDSLCRERRKLGADSNFGGARLCAERQRQHSGFFDFADTGAAGRKQSENLCHEHTSPMMPPFANKCWRVPSNSPAQFGMSPTLCGSCHMLFGKSHTTWSKTRTPCGKSPTTWSKTRTTWRMSRMLSGKSQTKRGKTPTPCGKSPTTCGKTQTSFGMSQTSFGRSPKAETSTK
jgi:hypothetical protein